MFSNIDAILDQPINEIMNKLPLEAHMKDALVDGSGEMGALLSLINAYLRGRWRYVAILTDKLRIDDAALHNHYREACEWANNLF